MLMKWYVDETVQQWDNSYEVVTMVKVEHTRHDMMPSDIIRCLGLVLTEGNYFSNFTGGIETRDVPTGLDQWPYRGGSKARGKVKLSKIMVSSALFTLEISGQ